MLTGFPLIALGFATLNIHTHRLSFQLIIALYFKRYLTEVSKNGI